MESAAAESARTQFVIHIDRDTFKVDEPTITGAGLRALASPPIGPDRDLYLEQQGPGGEADLLVHDDQIITLENGMHFFTAPHHITPGRKADCP